MTRRCPIEQFELEEICEPLAGLARETSAEILNYRAADTLETETKADDTPVTAADLAAHERLVAGNACRRAAGAVRGVRNQAAGRLGWDRFWMVDPLDGTKEFLARTGEFTINIALIEGECAYGRLRCPPAAPYTSAPGGVGAWKLEAGNRVPIRTRPLAAGTVVVLASRRHRGEKLDACLAALDSQVGELRRDNAGSALKFCQLAEGLADFYPRYSPLLRVGYRGGPGPAGGGGRAVLGLDGRPLL